jgi:uncharacterized protein YdiU (UPF0061 family)
LASQNDLVNLKLLILPLNTIFPAITSEEEPSIFAFFAAVESTRKMIIEWQRVGFCSWCNEYR